jgi:hypothetical protein
MVARLASIGRGIGSCYVSQLRVNARFQSVGLMAMADTLTRISFSPTVGVGRNSVLMVVSSWTMTARWVAGRLGVVISMIFGRSLVSLK